MNKISFSKYHHPMELDINVSIPETFKEKDLCLSLDGKRDIWVVLLNNTNSRFEAVNIGSCFPKDSNQLTFYLGIYYSLFKLLEDKLVYSSKKGAEQKAKLINEILNKELKNA